jgi:hypothetical protein
MNSCWATYNTSHYLSRSGQYDMNSCTGAAGSSNKVVGVEVGWRSGRGNRAGRQVRGYGGEWPSCGWRRAAAMGVAGELRRWGWPTSCICGGPKSAFLATSTFRASAYYYAVDAAGTGLPPAWIWESRWGAAATLDLGRSQPGPPRRHGDPNQGGDATERK